MIQSKAAGRRSLCHTRPLQPLPVLFKVIFVPAWVLPQPTLPVMPPSDNTAASATGGCSEDAASLLDTDEELAALDPAARQAMLQGMAERAARAARGEVFGPPEPVPMHGSQPGTPQASGVRSSPPPIRRRSRSPRTTQQSDRLPAPALEDTTSTPLDANYFVEIRVDPSRPILLSLQIRILPAEIPEAP